MSSFYCYTLIFVGLLATLVRVDAHGHLSVPTSRESTLRQDQQNMPVAFPLASDFICKNMPDSPSSNWATLTAGQSANIQWAMEAQHPGDCYAYLSYDISKDDTQKKWFKVGQWRDCHLMNVATQTFTVPAYLPPCDHCILRWEWQAMHLVAVNEMEFYAQCADVKIVSNVAKNAPLPTPQVTIPGHIPMSAKFYRNPYTGDVGPLVGPPMASLGGASYDCASSYDDSCTVAPNTGNPCIISHQRCVQSNTYQACQIGTSALEWGPEMSCQDGLVCADAGDNAHIYCVRPGTYGTPPADSSTTGKPVATTPVTTGKSAVVSLPPTMPSTTGKPVATAPVTTGKPVTSSSTQPCTLRDQKCIGTNQYQTCTNGRPGEDNFWATVQSCNLGTMCHPSATGNNIYCY